MHGWRRTGATGRTGWMTWSVTSKSPRRDLVRREEGLDRELLQGDVERGAEGGDDAHEGQAPDPQRHDDLARAGQLDSRLLVVARVAPELHQQAGELRVVRRR